MKRALFTLIAICIAVAAIAAGNTLPNQVRETIERAIHNEREAAARYEVFAAKAAEEGYPGAASLFRAMAHGETTHAKRFERILAAHDHPVPEAQTYEAKAGDTASNLRAAAAAEMSERDSTYRDAIDVCNMHRLPEVAAVFDQTRDSEVEHANLCTTAVRGLDALKQPKTFHVCDKCGFATDISLPFCPACRAKGALKTIE